MTLWDKLSYFVESGREGRKVDLKRQLDLATNRDQAKFAKDVLAMLNTAGGAGYIVIGVVDAKARTSTDPNDYIAGFQPPDIDAFERLMLQTVDKYCEPPLEVRYEEIIHPTTSRTLGVVIIPRSSALPHVVKREGETIRENDVYIRRGAETFRASREDLRRLTDMQRSSHILVNFHYPLTEAARHQLERRLGTTLADVIDVPWALQDNEPYEPQMQALVQTVGLTREEWQSLSIIVNVHPFAPATAVLMGVLHGLQGHFPTVLRLRRGADTNEFEIAEVLDVQAMRNQIAREGT